MKHSVLICEYICSVIFFLLYDYIFRVEFYILKQVMDIYRQFTHMIRRIVDYYVSIMDNCHWDI